MSGAHRCRRDFLRKNANQPDQPQGAAPQSPASGLCPLKPAKVEDLCNLSISWWMGGGQPGRAASDRPGQAIATAGAGEQRPPVLGFRRNTPAFSVNLNRLCGAGGLGGNTSRLHCRGADGIQCSQTRREIRPCYWQEARSSSGRSVHHVRTVENGHSRSCSGMIFTSLPQQVTRQARAAGAVLPAFNNPPSPNCHYWMRCDESKAG